MSTKTEARKSYLIIGKNTAFFFQNPPHLNSAIPTFSSLQFLINELLFVQIALRLIFIYNVTRERTVKISKVNIDQLPVSNTRSCSFLSITT